MTIQDDGIGFDEPLWLWPQADAGAPNDYCERHFENQDGFLHVSEIPKIRGRHVWSGAENRTKTRCA